MSRTKKNWDVLVDNRGNYDFLDTFKGGSGDKGIKGEKGEKGEYQPAFNYIGEVPTVGDLPVVPPPSPGDVHQIEADGSFWVYGKDGQWHQLTASITAIKGEKGEVGQKGENGEKGERGEKGESARVLNFLGQVPTAGDFPANPEEGDTWLNLETNQYYAWDGSEWVNLGELVEGPKGEKGEVGEKGYVGRDGDKGEVGQKGQKGDMANVDDYYTKGEVTTILENYYTKGETYDRGYIDAKFNDRYTKGEVDALIEAAEGSYYSLRALPDGDNAAKLVFTDTKTKGETIIPVTATDTLGLEVVAGGLAFGKTLKEPLNYQGTITPPEDPANLEADPQDGYFFVYDTSGTAWNGEEVLAGNWVVYSEDNTEWNNVFVGVDPGVQTVTVSGGVLELEGTASDVVINLDKDDLQDALDDRYLHVDGTNKYQAVTLEGDQSSLSLRNNTEVDLNIAGSNVVKVTSSKVQLAGFVEVPYNYTISFSGGNGSKLNLVSGDWGALTYGLQKTPQIQWGDDGIRLWENLSMDGNGSTTGMQRIVKMADPVDAQDAATKAYVDSKDYVLPVATDSVLGGVKVGDNLGITLDGTLSVKTVDGLDDRYIIKNLNSLPPLTS